MADISFRLAGHRVNLRVGGILIDGGCILLNRLEREPYWFLPGGRIQIGESSPEAIQREAMEELGVACTVGRPVFLLENFFSIAGEPFHEIGLYYLLDAGRHALPSDGGRTPIDGGTLFRWQPLDGLGVLDFRPAALVPHLNPLPASLIHIVSRDPT
jgi:8-oxo-dGTP pyrophosphatase MutT (NUDIX family)